MVENNTDIKECDEVILDKDFANASNVKVVAAKKLFAIVCDGNETWQVMKYRLSKIVNDGIGMAK